VDERELGWFRTEIIELHSTIRIREMFDQKRLILITEPLAVPWVESTVFTVGGADLCPKGIRRDKIAPVRKSAKARHLPSGRVFFRMRSLPGLLSPRDDRLTAGVLTPSPGIAFFCESRSLRSQRLSWEKRDASRTFRARRPWIRRYSPVAVTLA
jgi:hypothetical protein